MELERILAELWRRRLWLLPGLLIAIAAAVFVSHQRKSVEIAHGTAQMLVDTRKSSVADLGPDLEPMVTRANVYARLLASPALVDLIGRAARIPAGEIYAQGPIEQNAPRAVQEPTSQRRAGQLAGESGRYRLSFDSRAELPIVTVDVTAPTADEATRLAQGTVTGLQTYVRRLQRRGDIPARRRVEIRQLGQASGRLVNDGAAKQLAVLAAVGAGLLWMLLVLVASALARARRGITGPAVDPPGVFNVWTVGENGHSEQWITDENGHSEQWITDENGHSEQWIPEENGHSEPWTPAENGHAEPLTPEENGHAEPLTPEENGQVEPWALEANGQVEPWAHEEHGPPEQGRAERAPDP